jgi:hypothetical protein
MAMTKQLVKTVGLAAGVIGAVAAGTAQTPVGATTRRLVQRLQRDVRYAAASAPGIVYRLAGRHPDPNVSDDILADRIRSDIGPLEQRLDVPHVHVMVEDHVAVLHGEVSDDDDVKAIEHAVLGVSGVRGVESHLRPSLAKGDTRPSEGAHPTLVS